MKIIKYLLYYIFKFDKWHLSTFSERNYAIAIVNYLNDKNNKNSRAIVEIGCGLGDILKNVNYDCKYALDNDSKVLKAFKFISKIQFRNNIIFQEFNFPSEKLEKIYDTIVLVNWIHHIPPEILKSKINLYFTENLKVGGEIIIDIVQNEKYLYNHSIIFLTSDLEPIIKKIGDFEMGRIVYAIIKN